MGEANSINKQSNLWANIGDDHEPGFLWTVFMSDAPDEHGIKCLFAAYFWDEREARGVFEACWPTCPEEGGVVLVRAWVNPALKDSTDVRRIAVYSCGGVKEYDPDGPTGREQMGYPTRR
jgi:hypothetical protein